MAVVAILVIFLDLFVPAFSGILLLRIILSYVVGPGNRFQDILVSLTEPVLVPVRRVLPAAGGIDFAPLVTILLLQALESLVNGLLPG